VDEKTQQKIEDIKKGVDLIADGINSYDNIVRKELTAAFGAVHSTLLNWIAFAVLKAISDRSEFDDRFYLVIKEAAQSVKRMTG